jgi:hypothetical protein
MNTFITFLSSSVYASARPQPSARSTSPLQTNGNPDGYYGRRTRGYVFVHLQTIGASDVLQLGPRISVAAADVGIGLQTSAAVAGSPLAL